ncbi:MAG: aspartate aminotransferase family protein [Liquorilactobacillus satsumensis]|uniref:aspartate aminotransferase family protein n=1 Tax=Liquorilactobacillus satsumensis TaxID=259059 RepID=UPI0039EC7249
MKTAFEKRTDPWKDVEQHVGRYGAPFFIPEIIDHANGSYIYTESGRKILDFTSGQMSSTLGHSNPEVVQTIQQASARLDHLFSGMLSRPSINLCTKIAHSTADLLPKVIPLTTGSEVNEAALRLAKAVTGKFEVVSFNRSWHGVTEASAGATYSAARKLGVPGSPGQLSIPTPYSYRPDFVNAAGSLDWQKQLDYGFSMVDAQSVGSLAACIVEPIVSGGGILVPPPGYLAALKRKCHERGMLLIFDEAQTGFARTGDWYAFQHEEVTPDILTLSKTLGAGLPLAALVTTAQLEQAAYANGFIFYTSHVNDPLVAAVGCTVMDIIERDQLAAQALEKGQFLHKGLQQLVATHEIVGDARGRGLLQGIEIIKDSTTKERAAELGNSITTRCFQLGLHMNIVCLPGMGGVFRIAPPLTVSYAELTVGLQILDQAITEVEAQL